MVIPRQMGASASQACTRSMGSDRRRHGTSTLNGTDLLYHVTMLDYALSTEYQSTEGGCCQLEGDLRYQEES